MDFGLEFAAIARQAVSSFKYTLIRLMYAYADIVRITTNISKYSRDHINTITIPSYTPTRRLQTLYVHMVARSGTIGPIILVKFYKLQVINFHSYRHTHLERWNLNGD